MIIREVEFVKSSPSISQCPEQTLPEYAFIGRSNVGKSSLINMLVERKGLAKTSGKPGKTQLINHFVVNNEWHLVDLPGYGYAKVSKELRAKFEKMISNYLSKRENLINTFVLIDSRLEPQAIDLEFMQWMGEKQLPFTMVFTKIDKLSSVELQKNRAVYKKKMLQVWEEMPPSVITSAESKIGRMEILSMIEHYNQVFKENK